MKTLDVVMIIVSNFAAIVSLGAFLYRMFYKKPFEKGFRQGWEEGRESGLRDGVAYGFEVAKSFGRRSDDSRNKEKLINEPRIRDFIERKANKVDRIQFNLSEFQAENNDYLISLYSGLGENARRHIDEIERKASITESKGKKLLVLLVLVGVSSEIAHKRLETFKEIKAHFDSNPSVVFETFIEVDSQFNTSDFKQLIDEFVRREACAAEPPPPRRKSAGNPNLSKPE